MRRLVRAGHAACNTKLTRTASKGKTIRPPSSFRRMPTSSRACTSPCTALTSRSTRRAASRRVTGPAPVSAESNSHRFWVSTLNSRAGVSKLMKAPCGSPSKARRKRRSTSSRDETSRVTVRISGPPVIDSLPKIGEELSGCSERIGALLLADVPVVPFSGFVVKAEHARSPNHQSQAVLEAMLAHSNGRGDLPDHHLHEGILGEDAALVEQGLGLH